MNISDLYRRIASVTTRYEFTDPVTDDDLDTVRAALVSAVPEECRTLVMHAGKSVLVEVWDGDRRVYAREMLAR